MTLAPGSEFAGYRIVRLLGVGGMGTVYLARHPRLPRNDALKLLSADFAQSADTRKRFEREADITAGLTHKNIVSVYDRGAIDDELWIAMQFIEGRDAADLIKAGPKSLTPRRAVNIITDVARGLDYAHRHGLLHRDVKPANILVRSAPDEPSGEQALITDFGIARTTNETQHLTVAGDIIATIAYASPEQLEGRELDHHSDVYALGCTLYEMLTGEKPFARASMPAMINAHLSAPPPHPSDKMPSLPLALDEVIARAMAKNPRDRFNTCRDLADAANRALYVQPPPVQISAPQTVRTSAPQTVQAPIRPLAPHTPPRPPGPPHGPVNVGGALGRAQPPRSRRPLVIGAAATAAAVFLVAVVFAIRNGSDDGATQDPISTSTTPVNDDPRCTDLSNAQCDLRKRLPESLSSYTCNAADDSVMIEGRAAIVCDGSPSVLLVQLASAAAMNAAIQKIYDEGLRENRAATFPTPTSKDDWKNPQKVRGGTLVSTAKGGTNVMSWNYDNENIVMQAKSDTLDPEGLRDWWKDNSILATG